MPQNTTIAVAANTWVMLTDADVSAVTFQVRPSGSGVFIAGTTGTSAPTSTSGAWFYTPNRGEANAAMPTLFPGLAAVRLWAFAEEPASVTISHA